MSDLSRLLRPKSVCYVGGTQIAGPIRASRKAGYEGAIYVVNPTRNQIEGVACTPSFADLPEVPDAVVIGMSPERSIQAVRELTAMGAGGAVVMTSGFAELGDKGKNLQQDLIDAAGDMPLLGPNCMGLINQFSGAAVWGDDNYIERQEGPAAAIISQSGALLIGMTNVERAFPLGYGISLGNQAVTSTAELIESILEDDRIRAIGLYLEGMNEGQPLGQACLKALKKNVPVVVLKGGDSAAGAEVALSHTASMVVERDLWEAFCDRFGLVEVSSPKALVETLKLLTIGGLPAGNRVSIVSYSGGLNGLAATRAAPLGLNLPMPSAENHQFMADLLPDTVAIHNPLDLNIPFTAREGISMQDAAGVSEAISAFAEGVTDQIIFFIDIPKPDTEGLDKVWCDSLEALIEVKKKLGVPVSVAGILPEGLPDDFRNHMNKNGVAALLGYSEAMEALSVSVKLSKIQQEKISQQEPLPLLGNSVAGRSVMLDEAHSKDVLKARGLMTPDYRAVSVDEAVSAAEAIGYPVAVKVLSNEIAHKAKMGGVHLHLASADEVEKAAQQICADVKAAGGLVVSRLLVEKMVPDAIAEVIIGVKRHPALGIALVVGRGGGRVEEMARFETILLPLEEGVLEVAFEKLGFDLLGTEALMSLKVACEAVAAYALLEQERLVTLDVNPVMVTKSGATVATDALIVLTEEGAK